MFGAILKATHSSFQKGITFCRSIYVKKEMKLLAFIFEQPSYNVTIAARDICIRESRPVSIEAMTYRYDNCKGKWQ